MAEIATDVIKRYLEDAIAAEKSFETQLNEFGAEGDDIQVQTVFRQHAIETKSQYERLTVRLESLGGTPSSTKSFMAHLFGMAPKTAQIGHEKQERVTQNLIIAFAVENTEIAMYESLAAAAETAGDALTMKLAREIQQEERTAAEKVFKLIPSAAMTAFERVASGPPDTTMGAAARV